MEKISLDTLHIDAIDHVIKLVEFINASQKRLLYAILPSNNNYKLKYKYCLCACENGYPHNIHMLYLACEPIIAQELTMFPKELSTIIAKYAVLIHHYNLMDDSIRL